MATPGVEEDGKEERYSISMFGRAQVKRNRGRGLLHLLWPNQITQGPFPISFRKTLIYMIKGPLNQIEDGAHTAQSYIYSALALKMAASEKKIDFILFFRPIHNLL